MRGSVYLAHWAHIVLATFVFMARANNLAESILGPWLKRFFIVERREYSLQAPLSLVKALCTLSYRSLSLTITGKHAVKTSLRENI